MLARMSLVLLVVISSAAFAGELELFGGANRTTYDDASDANTSGLTMRLQYNFTRDEDTWFINMYAPGLGILASDLSAGYLWRTHGDFYFEGGVGAGYSRIRGPNPVLIAGMGYRASQTVFFDLPLMLFGSGLVWMPYIGISF